MAAGKQSQQQGAVAAAEPSAARRLWRVVRAVLYMLRRGLPSGRKLAMDLSLLLHRGKIAGRALGELLVLAFHHGHHGRHNAAAAFTYAGADGAGHFSCRALDPTLAVHEPAPRGRRREVEFSCSNTPSSGALGLLGAGKRRRRKDHRGGDGNNSGGYLQQYCYNYDAAEVARMFEMLNDDDGEQYRLFTGDGGAETSAEASSAATSATATPSSAAQLLYWAAVSSSSPAAMAAAASRSMTPRAAGSPGVDRQADEFIRRFYEQLRAQRSAASTPDYYGYTAAAGVSPYVTPRARRPVAAAAATGVA
ncbi:unnamed protein product [Urochloa decumbens]|uniref:Uncharacterized protein n=1 Tax=Urochloa decumbens TaxID=240449 RepID=A0ABC8VE37_9POAL